jgi:hypothetical protein
MCLVLKKWMMFAFAPVLLTVPFVLFCVWIIVDETRNPRCIDGMPDNAPRMAAGILGFLSVVCQGIWTCVVLCIGIIKSLCSARNRRKIVTPPPLPAAGRRPENHPV